MVRKLQEHLGEKTLNIINIWEYQSFIMDPGKPIYHFTAVCPMFVEILGMSISLCVNIMSHNMQNV